MSNRLGPIGIVTLLAVLSVFADYVNGQSDLSEAERVAKSYMTAFFQGDIETAANLTHPGTLAALKKSFLIQLDKAYAEGRQQALLKEIGVQVDAKTLRNMNPHDLYVTIVRSNQNRGQSDVLKAMKKSKVKIVKSELLNPNEAAVQLKIITPDAGTAVDQTTGVLLTKYGQEWRVKTTLE